jgi:hypothetical protein
MFSPCSNRLLLQLVQTACVTVLCTSHCCFRWNCAELGEVWGVTQGQLKQQAGIDGKALNVEQSLDDLKIALGVVVSFSAVAAVGSGLASKFAL